METHKHNCVCGSMLHASTSCILVSITLVSSPLQSYCLVLFFSATPLFSQLCLYLSFWSLAKQWQRDRFDLASDRQDSLLHLQLVQLPPYGQSSQRKRKSCRRHYPSICLGQQLHSLPIYLFLTREGDLYFPVCPLCRFIFPVLPLYLTRPAV